MMDQTAVEGAMDERATEGAMDGGTKRVQATEEGIIESAMYGARDGSVSNRLIREYSKEQWMMDQTAVERAMTNRRSDG